MTYDTFQVLDEHPVPFDQDEIDELWEDNLYAPSGKPPHIDEAHTEYVYTIADYGCWHVFRTAPPFGDGRAVYFWNREGGDKCLKVNDLDGNWHHLVNLFAEIVDEEGDCRDADISSSLMPDSSHEQHCSECGGSWSI